jgi:Tol biopolymer transport system component
MQDCANDRNRLESWKQIAAHLNKSERTVRRWHETEGLPVHKHKHQQKGSVWAYPDELQQWLARRVERPESPESPESPIPAAKPRRYWLWVTSAGLAAAGLAIVLLRPAPPVAKQDPIPLTVLPGSEYGASVSPDGKRIAFHWKQVGRSASGIYVKEIGKDAVIPIAVAPSDIAYLYSPAWSPDGRTIAFLERTPSAETWLCVISSSGGARRRLKQIAAAPTIYFGNYQHVSWSRDNRWIIVPMALGSQQGIYRVSADSGTSVAITKGNSAYSPALSPDGRRLVSLRHEGLPITSTEILVHELNSDGEVTSGPVVVYKGHSSTSGITWLTDSKSLVLCSSEPSMVGPTYGRLFRFPAVAGAEMKEIGGDGCNTVTITPDGSLVYGFTPIPRSKMLRARLQVREPATEFLASSRYDAIPRFSPDGQQVAFYSNRSGRSEIWVARQDGMGLRRVAEGTRAHSEAAWSPNSDRLVYVSGESLAISDLSGGKPQTIDLAGSVAQHPVWPVDGKMIYYTAKSHLWRVRSDGTGREMLRELPPILELHASPDGKYLYYSTAGKRFTLCRVPVEGGAEEIIQDGLDLPSFAIGKRALYFVRADMNLWSQDLSGGRIESLGLILTNHISGNATWDTRFTVSPDGSIAIWVLSSAQEIDLAMQKLEITR